MTLQNLINTVNANDKFDAKYGHLATGGKLSDNQKKFIRAAERAGLELFAYSGRFMFGDRCPAVSVDVREEFSTRAKVRTDSMGRGYVLYAQS
jgi:hypothetical protein